MGVVNTVKWVWLGCMLHVIVGYIGHTIKESSRHSFSTDLEQNKMLRVGGGGSSTSP